MAFNAPHIRIGSEEKARLLACGEGNMIKRLRPYTNGRVGQPMAGSISVNGPTTNACATVYSGTVWTEDYQSSTLQDAWRSLITQSDLFTSVYQTPDFFDHLLETEPRSNLNVLTVNSTKDGIISVVPVRRKTLHMPFSVGNLTLAKLRFSSLEILGSQPMVRDDDQGALDRLFLMIFETISKRTSYRNAVSSSSRFHLEISQVIKSTIIPGLYPTSCRVTNVPVMEVRPDLVRPAL